MHEEQEKSQNAVGTKKSGISAAAKISYEGPLPPSSEFERYNFIVPGAAERILAMAERSLAHAHDIEKKQLEEGVKIEKMGTYLGFILGAGAFLAALVALHWGYPYVAVTFVSFPVMRVILGLISTKNQKNTNS